MNKQMQKAMLAHAISIAKEYHKDQIDKCGIPYINHVMSVLGYVTINSTDYNVLITAVLHDIVEDTDLTLKDLQLLGFSSTVVDAVDAISRRKKESANNYYKRLMMNDIAVIVKIADLKHNKDITRFKEIDKTKEIQNKMNYYDKRYSDLYLYARINKII